MSGGKSQTVAPNMVIAGEIYAPLSHTGCARRNCMRATRTRSLRSITKEIMVVLRPSYYTDFGFGNDGFTALSEGLPFRGPWAGSCRVLPAHGPGCPCGTGVYHPRLGRDAGALARRQYLPDRRQRRRGSHNARGRRVAHARGPP